MDNFKKSYGKIAMSEKDLSFIENTLHLNINQTSTLLFLAQKYAYKLDSEINYGEILSRAKKREDIGLIAFSFGITQALVENIIKREVVDGLFPSKLYTRKEIGIKGFSKCTLGPGRKIDAREKLAVSNGKYSYSYFYGQSVIDHPELFHYSSDYAKMVA